jgi:vitamin B12 transporter
MASLFFSFSILLLSVLFNIAGVSAVSAADAPADQKSEELGAVEVRAARNALPVEKLPSSVSVITREQMEAKKYLNVESLLREELGLDVVRNGPMGANTTVFMRGGGSSSTLVMVDGVQVNSNTTGAFNFANFPIDNLERVEMIRGPQSTLWGADAVGGVINLVTRQGKGTPTHSASFEGGSFSTFKETLGSSGGTDKVDYSISASRTDSAGFSSASQRRGNTEKDGYENTAVSTRLGYNFLDDGRADFIGHFIKSRIDFDNFSFPRGMVDGPPYSNQESAYISLPVAKSLTPWWQVKFNPNLAYDEVVSRRQTTADSYFYNRTYTLDLQNNFKLGEWVSTIVGGEYQYRNGESPDNRINRTLENQSTYLQTILDNKENVVLTAGFRHDVNNPFRDATTYKFEGAYKFNSLGTRLRSAYATGFRAPTVNDLFYPGASNPALKPEEVRSWEAGFDQTFLDGKVVVGSVYFDSYYDNLIQFDLATFMPQNVAKAVSKGTETFVRLKLPEGFNLTTNHTWNDAYNDITKRRLARRAEQKFHANISRHWTENFDTLVGITYKGNTEENAIAGTSSYVIMRAAMTYRINKYLKFTVRGENLLNTDYEEISGFGTPGASGYAGFVVTY